LTAPGTDVAEVVEVERVQLIPDWLPTKEESVEGEVAAFREQAETIIVDDQESAEAALEFVKALTKLEKDIEAGRVSLTKPRKDAAEEIKRRFDAMKAPVVAVKETALGKVSDWKAEEDRKAAERQRAVEAEQRRIEEEARAKREAAERAEREARELAEEEDSPDATAIAEQLASDARADVESAAIVEDAIASVPSGSPAAAPALKGFSRPRRWAIKSIDRAKLPAEYLIPDEKAIAEAMRDGVRENRRPPEIPGVEFHQVTGSAVRS
jgi:DNA repair exonuclease SbcCD ATPase subunit